MKNGLFYKYDELPRMTREQAAEIVLPDHRRRVMAALDKRDRDREEDASCQ